MWAYRKAASRESRAFGRSGGDGRRSGATRALCRRGQLGAFATLAATAASLVLAAAASAFSAQGSVEQVYVTGLESGAQMSLLKSTGETVATQNANSLGGLL